MAAKTEVMHGFFLVIGAIVAIYVGGLIIARLPQ
jgi:hypothetical protein